METLPNMITFSLTACCRSVLEHCCSGPLILWAIAELWTLGHCDHCLSTLHTR